MARYTALNRNGDFVRAYKRGRSEVHPLLVTYLQRNRNGDSRIGITATKKVGGAVQRNRAKRLIRAAYADLLFPIPCGWDAVFVARSRTPRASMQQVRDAMRRQLDKLLPPPPPPAT